MKKTVNINLAGLLFHIDEDAYLKLADYLEAIRRSIGPSPSSDEIIRDIEARIAELFSERMPSPQHVVGLRELNEVILVMGQPEDYKIDYEDSDFEESFEESRDQKSSSQYRRLYRDEYDKWVAGVSSGIAHYFNLDPLWIRLSWIVLVLIGLGSPVLIYLVLWILVPPALTTAEKLRMHGEPINISNIEKKFREGYENVRSKMKDVDEKYGPKVKTETSRFFSSMGKVMRSIFRLFGYAIGVLTIVISASVVLGLLISFLRIGSLEVLNPLPYNADIPLPFNSIFFPPWLILLLLFLAFGIPFFALFILGLKLLIPHLNPLPKSVSIILWLFWIGAILALIIGSIRGASAQAFLGHTVTEDVFETKAQDTLYLAMKKSSFYGSGFSKNKQISPRLNEDDKTILFSQNISVALISSKHNSGKIIVERTARGGDFLAAKKRAETISYSYALKDQQLIIDPYFTIDALRPSDEQVKITVVIPEQQIFFLDASLRSYLESNNVNKTPLSHFYKFDRDRLHCTTCATEQELDENKKEENNKIIDSSAIESSEPLTEDWEERVLKSF